MIYNKRYAILEDSYSKFTHNGIVDRISINEITGLIDKCEIYDCFILIIFFKNFTDNLFLKKRIINDQKNILNFYKDYCEKNNLQLKVLLDCYYEAPSYKFHLSKYCDFLVDFLKINLDDIIIYGVGQHQLNDNINFITNNNCCKKIEMLENIDVTIPPSYHFLSLSRIAKPHRLYATTQIIDRNLQNYGKISFGSGFYNDSIENEIINYLPEKYKKLFPMIIDEQIIGLDRKQYSTADSLFNSAFVNLVHETAVDYDLNFLICEKYNITKKVVGEFIWKNLIIQNTSNWNINGFTEKSLKPFAWGQIPIFNTVYDNTKYIRDLGFDLFDDLIDHSYDTIKDPFLRIDAIIIELEKICNLSIDACKEYKKQNIHRFIKNQKIVEELFVFKFQEMGLESMKKALDRYKN